MRKIGIISLMLYLLFGIIGTEVCAKQTTTQNDHNIRVEYVYNENENTVTAKIISNKELEDTKPTWKLSSDKKVYIKNFDFNQEYDTGVQDTSGNNYTVTVKITQIKEFSVEVQYEYNKEKSQVVAKIVSNMKMLDTKPTWSLSNDKMTYTKIFNCNETYTTLVTAENLETCDIEINISEIKDFEITKKYIHNEKNNSVTVMLESSRKLKDTKPTWNLSDDGCIYTKEFFENEKYSTIITDVDGNTIVEDIDINGLEDFIINVKYEYTEKTNTVEVTIDSSIELIDNKPTWNLSNEKNRYTKIFSNNQDYTTDITNKYGRKKTINIKVTQIDETPPVITFSHMFNDDGSVTVYLSSDKAITDNKPTWKLSDDLKVYSKTFNSDQNYLTSVEATNGQTITVKINIKIRSNTYTQNDGTSFYVRYLYKDNSTVDVEVCNNCERFNNTKPTWNLSSDSKKYSKSFSDNTTYDTSFNLKNGKSYTIPILVTEFQRNNTGTLKGVDVSGHQGNIDWVAVKNSGIDFAILRCGYGENLSSQDDSCFVRNINECERLGIEYGVYLYSYALTENGAISEANHVLRLIRGHEVPLGVWFDMEDADGYKQTKGMPSDATLVDICKTFCDTIRANGYGVGIYASYYWFVTSLNDSKLDVYDKWVAQWSSRCSYTKPYKMWQYTSTGTVNGINGNVDMNYLYR